MRVLFAFLWGMSHPASAQNQNSSPVELDEVQRASLRAAKLQQMVAVCDSKGNAGWEAAVASFESDAVALMTPVSSGGYRTAARLESPRGPRSVVCADFNRDGTLDVASANFFSGDILVFIGHGNGGFEPPRGVHSSRVLRPWSRPI